MNEALFEAFITPWSTDHAVERLEEFYLNREFTGARETIEPQAVQVIFQPARAVEQYVTAEPRRVRLWTTEKSRAIQFSTAMCAYNVLRAAYRHFEDHLREAKDLFERYFEEMSPRECRIGQRYLNLISLPENQSPSTYLAVYPEFPSAIAKSNPPFGLYTEAAKLSSGQLALSIVQTGRTEGRVHYLLDLYAQSGNIAPNWSAFSLWQREAHAQISAAFELCITPAARALFEERSHA